jgi:hypothetical protein
VGQGQILHILFCNKGLKCLYVEMAEYLSEQLVVVSQWLSLRSTGVLEMVFDLPKETDWSSSVVYLKTETRYSWFLQVVLPMQWPTMSSTCSFADEQSVYQTWSRSLGHIVLQWSP